MSAGWQVRQGRLLAALFLSVAGLAQAHGVRDDVRVDLAPVQIDGLSVELHQDFFSPQLVVANDTGKVLEILDDEGRAFLKIGPGQVEADLAAKAYHLSRVAGGGDAHANTLSDTPRWRQVNREAHFGWFDARLSTATLQIPYALNQLGEEMPFAEWRIPVRLGDERMTLRGVFTYTPPPRGVAIASLLSPAVLAPGVSAQLLPGPVPVIFLRNAGELPVLVLDAEGKAFLKIARNGVWADVGSAAWRASTVTHSPGGSGWQQISKANTHSWLEPRAAWRGKLPKPLPANGRLNEWQLPLQIGSQTRVLRGVNRWVARTAPVAMPAAR